MHGLPPITRRWKYDHAELTPLLYRDIKLEAITGTGSWTGGAIRRVAGYDPGHRTVNRGGDSFTTLDSYSIGIAHWWADTAPEPLAEIARREPDLAAWAWGGHTAEQLEDEDWLRSRHPPQCGKTTLQPELNWLLSGWWACARHPSVASIQCELWLDQYVGHARTAAHQLGWGPKLKGSDGGKILAALTRAANSGRGSTQIHPFRQNDGALAPRWSASIWQAAATTQEVQQAGSLEEDRHLERIRRAGAGRLGQPVARARLLRCGAAA